MAADLAALAGRLLLAAIFVEAGFSGFANILGTAGYFASLGFPAPLGVAAAVSLFELSAGLLLAVGLATRIAAVLLALFAVAAAFIGHLMQSSAGDMVAFMHWQAFMKDLAIAGGMVMLALAGPRRFSLDAWLQRFWP